MVGSRGLRKPDDRLDSLPLCKKQRQARTLLLPVVEQIASGLGNTRVVTITPKAYLMPDAIDHIIQVALVQSKNPLHRLLAGFRNRDQPDAGSPPRYHLGKRTPRFIKLPMLGRLLIRSVQHRLSDWIGLVENHRTEAKDIGRGVTDPPRAGHHLVGNHLLPWVGIMVGECGERRARHPPSGLSRSFRPTTRGHPLPPPAPFPKCPLSHTRTSDRGVCSSVER